MHQPTVFNVFEKAPDVSLDDPPVFPAVEGNSQVLTGLARPYPTTVSDAFIDEVRFPDRFKDHLDGLLHNLVFQHGNA